jgi:sec-independent protein translocase protein TatA
MVLPLADIFGFQGIILLAILGVLLYGERLPEVAAKFGRQLMELRKAADAVRSEITSVATDAKYTVAHSLEKAEESAREDATAPKSEPPPGETSEEPSANAVAGEAR